jgi:hypothetical protein
MSLYWLGGLQKPLTGPRGSAEIHLQSETRHLYVTCRGLMSASRACQYAARTSVFPLFAVPRTNYGIATDPVETSLPLAES